MIVAATGQHGNGKTFMGRFLIDCGYDLKIFSFAKPLKELSERITGIKVDAYNKDTVNVVVGQKKLLLRTFLKTFGQKMREIDEQFWVRMLLDELEKELSKNSKSVHILYIDDLRYINEFEQLKIFAETHCQRFYSIRMERLDGVISGDEHPSETECFKMSCDKVIKNDFGLGTQAEILKIMEHL